MNDQVTPQERLAEQDWAGVAKTGVSSMAPADKGWILAVVVIVLVLQVGDTIQSWFGNERSARTAVIFGEQLTEMEAHRSDELRRCQEGIKEMAQAVSRQHEYQGRAQHEKTLMKE